MITVAMADVDGSCQFSADSAQVVWLDLRVSGHSALSLHSSNKPGELSRWWSWWQQHKRRSYYYYYYYTSAVNATLLAFAAERRAAVRAAAPLLAGARHPAPAAVVDQHLPPAWRSAANLRTPRLRSSDETHRQTDERTLDRVVYSSAYMQALSVI